MTEMYGIVLQRSSNVNVSFSMHDQRTTHYDVMRLEMRYTAAVLLWSGTESGL